jgi:DNA-directed RNA polymerase specialized sigma24 family protein
MKISLPIQLQRDSAARKDPGLASDCELAARIREGDRKALRRLVERHTGRLHSYLLHRLGEGSDDQIDRVVAVTFSDALRRLTPYAKGTATTPMNLWLIRLAERNLARTRNASSPKPLNPQSDLTRLRAAMSALPNRHKFVLSLAVFEQMPPSDIAAVLGTTPSGAMRRLRTALKRVGQVLAKQEEEDD